MQKDPRDKIEVLLVGPIPPPFGGIPTYVESLFRSDIDAVNFRLLNTAFPARIAPFNREGKRNYTSIGESGVWVAIKMIAFSIFNYILFIWKIIYERPQIVQVFTSSYWGYWRSLVFILLGKLLRRKTIFHLLNAIDIFFEESGTTQKRMINFSLNTADMYLVQSPLLRDWVREHTEKRVRYIWNGICLDRIPSAGEPPLFIVESTCPIGITIGGLGVNKGTSELVTVLSELNSEGIAVSWVFVGGGDVQEFRDLVKSKSLDERVTFLGRIDESEKWRYLHFADLFCLPSHAEGQPISIIEAMAVGLPIVSTDVGSISEMISNGSEGYVVPARDQESLKIAIEDLVLNPDRRVEMGTRALQKANERHNINGLFAGHVDVYKELMQI